MPKKTQRNGFYYFMLDFKKKEENNGIKFASLREVQESAKCSKEWQALSAEKKKMYNSKAKQEKQNGVEEKKTGLGESVKLIEQHALEAFKYEAAMKEDIDTTISNAIHCNRLEIIPFYFIHVNWYYTKIDLFNVVEYIPAEFSVIEFSFKHGVKRCYSEIIKVDIELGYTREAMEHSDATHRIDIYSKELKPANYKTLYNKFYDFLSRGDDSLKKLPPVYTSRQLTSVVPCLFEFMTQAAGVPKNTFDVYSLEYLFGTLMFGLNKDFPVDGNRALLAAAELEKDAFNWTPNIECAYHRKFEGGGPYCSQSIVTQWVYTLCDSFCPILNVRMITGKHTPTDVVDSVANSMESLSIKQYKTSNIISETGVSEEYRLRVSERTWEQNERRKKQGKPVTVINYGEIEEKGSIIVPSASSSTINTKGQQRQLRTPISLSEIFTGYVSESPRLDDESYPRLGAHKSKQLNKKQQI